MVLGQSFDPSAEQLGFGKRLDHPAIREQHDQLFAAIAARDIARANGADDRGGDLAQDRVAKGVALLVVEALEMVEIDHHDRQRAFAALGEADVAIEHVLHVAAVVEPGERVAQGLGAQLLAQRDIGEGERHGVGQGGCDRRYC